MPLKFLLSATVVLLLCYGVATDIKTRTVSNRVTLGIVLLSVPLIYYNSANINNQTYFIGLAFIGMYFINTIGGADLKALLPITFTVANLFYFLILFSAIGIAYCVIKREPKKIPAFIPITVAYTGVMFFA